MFWWFCLVYIERIAFNLFYHHICLTVTFIYVAEMLLISANIYLPNQGLLTYLAGMKTRLGWRGLSKTESETSLTQANTFISLSETEYNDGCQDQYSCSYQDTMVHASCTGYTRLMSKTNCQAKLVYALLMSRELSEAQEAGMFHCLRECLSF